MAPSAPGNGLLREKGALQEHAPSDCIDGAAMAAHDSCERHRSLRIGDDQLIRIQGDVLAGQERQPLAPVGPAHRKT